jgi:triacylglycerol lipase
MTLRKTHSLALALLLLVAVAHAQTNPFAKGPDPSSAGLEADGPFTVSTQDVRGSGFGGATVYSPDAAGQYAVVAFCPGFTATRSSVASFGRRLATHGFIVATIDTNSTLDLPPSRGTQLLAALRTVTALSTGPVAGKIDATRLVVTGWSMGGGGTLYASTSNMTVKTGVGLAPFSTQKRFNTGVPQLLIGGQDDVVAPVAIHSRAFFTQLPDATPKLYAVIAGAEHSFPRNTGTSQPASKLQIAWIKRFADNDTRYEQFLSVTGIQVDLANGRLSDSLREATPF